MSYVKVPAAVNTLCACLHALRSSALASWISSLAALVLYWSAHPSAAASVPSNQSLSSFRDDLLSAFSIEGGGGRRGDGTMLVDLHTCVYSACYIAACLHMLRYSSLLS